MRQTGKKEIIKMKRDGDLVAKRWIKQKNNKRVEKMRL
jgi:hypothetical protein